MRLNEDQTQILSQFILQNLDSYAVVNPDPEQLCKLIVILIEEDENSLQSNLLEYFEENTQKFCKLLIQELSRIVDPNKQDPEHYHAVDNGDDENLQTSKKNKNYNGSDNSGSNEQENEEIMENLANSSERNPLQRSDFSDNDEEEDGRDSNDSFPLVHGHKRYVQKEDMGAAKYYNKKMSRDFHDEKKNQYKKVQKNQAYQKGDQKNLQQENTNMPGLPQMQGPPLPNAAAMFQMHPGQQMMPQMPIPMQYWPPFNQMAPMFFPQPQFPYQQNDQKDKKGGYQKRNFQRNVKKDTVPDEIPKNQIYIKYIPDHYNSADILKKFYQKFGKIINIQTNWKEKIAIIEFKSNEEAQIALNQKELLFGLKQIIVTQTKADLSKSHQEIYEQRKQQEEKEKQEIIKNQKVQKQQQIKQYKPPHEAEKGDHKDQQKQSQQSQQQQQQQQKVNPILKNKVEKFQAQKDKKISENRKNIILQKFTNQLKLILFLKKRLMSNQQLYQELNDYYLQIQLKKEKLVKCTNAQVQEIEELIDNEEKNKLFDFNLIIQSLPEWANQASLIEQFEEFGKINQFKINQIQKTASLKFYTFECAEKAFLKTINLQLEFADSNLQKYLIDVEQQSRKQSQQVNEDIPL